MQWDFSRVRKAHFLFPLILLVAFAFLLVDAASYPAKPRQLPTAIITITMALLVVELFCSLQKPARSEAAKQGWHVWKVQRTLVSFPLFLVSAMIFGFVTSTMLYVAGLAWALGFRQPGKLLLISLGTAALMYSVFCYLLGVPLPKGFLV